jgi:hypothetical protein
MIWIFLNFIMKFEALVGRACYEQYDPTFPLELYKKKKF